MTLRLKGRAISLSLGPSHRAGTLVIILVTGEFPVLIEEKSLHHCFLRLAFV